MQKSGTRSPTACALGQFERVVRTTMLTWPSLVNSVLPSASTNSSRYVWPTARSAINDEADARRMIEKEKN